MSVKFNKNGKIFDSEVCLQGLNILAHSQMIELNVGSDCGGYGRCGGDRVRFSEADQKLVNGLTEIEKVHLSEEDLKKGWRLACQCFPNEDGLEFTVELRTDLRAN